MPDFTGPVGSTQRYIPALNRNQAARVPGTKKVFADHDAFVAGVVAERGVIEMGLPVWFDGEDLRNQSEPLAVVRRWSLSTTAGSNNANAAASHGRTVVIGPYSAVLAADSNQVRATSGQPSSGTGANGDLGFDPATGAIYIKAAGAWSAVVTLFGSGNAPSLPGAPTNVTAVAGNASAQVSWSAPASNGGSSITGYTITPSAGSALTVGNVLTANVTGLANGTPVTFTVRATNATGTGPASSASASVTPSATVVAPTITTHPSSQSIADGATVTLTVAANNGGGTLTYQWEVAAAGGIFSDVAGATSASYTSGALNTGMSGRQYRVKVTNSAGTVTSNIATVTVGTSSGDTDSFVSNFATGTDGTTLQDFVPISGTWSKQASSTSAGNAVIGSGRLRGTSSGTNQALMYTTGSVAMPGSGGVFAEATINVRDASAGLAFGLCLRGNNGTALNGLQALYSSTGFSIRKRDAGVDSILDSDAGPALALELDHKMRFTAASGVQKLYVQPNGSSTWTLVCEATEPDSAAITGTEVGVRLSHGSTVWSVDRGPQVKAVKFGTTSAV